VPKIIKQFDNAKQALPLMTRILIAFSDFMRNWGLWLLTALVVGGILFNRSLRNVDNRRRYHAFLLRVPLLGRVVRGTNTTRFARTLATLTSSAVPVLDALRISGEVVNNLPMREAVQTAAIKVREGSPIGRSLGATKQFPPMMIHLISSGESSGELETMLDRAASNQEREMDAVLGAFVGLLGPLMIIGMAVIVLFIVLAMLLPIFALNDLVGH
jgi:general secretion pathway protein F